MMRPLLGVVFAAGLSCPCTSVLSGLFSSADAGPARETPVAGAPAADTGGPGSREPQLAAVPSAAAPAVGTPAPSASLADAPLRRGRYFSYPQPAGWLISETTNGVDGYAPDISAGYSFSFVMGVPGQQSAQGYVQLLFGGMGPYTVTGSSPLPNLQLGPDTFVGQNLTLQNQVGPRSYFTSANVGLANNGMYWSGMTLLWYVDASRPELSLPAMQALAARVQMLPQGGGGGAYGGGASGGGAAGSSTLDNGYSGSQASQDRLSEARQQVLFGYEVTQDQNGVRYNADWGAYNPAAGGYVSPTNPGEVMTVVPPGE